MDVADDEPEEEEEDKEAEEFSYEDYGVEELSDHGAPDGYEDEEEQAYIERLQDQKEQKLPAPMNPFGNVTGIRKIGQNKK